jgi:hypothetical protein
VLGGQLSQRLPEDQPVDRGVCVLRIDGLTEIGAFGHRSFGTEPNAAAVIDDEVACDGEEPRPWRPIACCGDLGVQPRAYQRSCTTSCA